MTKIKMGMVGGGKDAFIGAVHRMAAQLDGEITLVCGAFSKDPNASVSFGQSLGLAPSRCYGTYQEMLEQEAKLPAAERMDMVAIVTPNHLHFPIAKAAIVHGFHIISDKPATLNLAEAKQLADLLNQSTSLYALTHTYTGYPMVKEAKYRISQGELGEIRKVVVQYPQGWLSSQTNDTLKQASWRLDPTQAGISCCMADIGVHAANLVEYISGLSMVRVCADLNTTLDRRVLDDDGTVLFKLENGSKGVLLASQIATGEENDLSIAIYGDKASLKWSQMAPNSLTLSYPDRSQQTIRTGVVNKSPLALANTRLPAGHPEGYIEAFANIYRNFAAQIRATKAGQEASESALDVPGIDAAIRGMQFIESTVAASRSELKWHPIAKEQSDA
ncbi:Glucose-6-phosphate 3-dehydrogenase [Pseudoalteromonas sp. P1-9]|uniref:Gfo/Idh/MocA family protein n=1 Tax=Pseudoalteromonas sp. P1-9 TaxID=1710354 RepID=UPI0006D5FF4A|nr:Gfo/Idh/MocA family oxidoreductase [Pseudoalteromonas sp. P1-9]KPV93737.1 Glucose-6-phosphate 3-dehydrogenase [Pseudoalteromonas sp. P1-9]